MTCTPNKELRQLLLVPTFCYLTYDPKKNQSGCDFSDYQKKVYAKLCEKGRERREVKCSVEHSTGCIPGTNSGIAVMIDVIYDPSTSSTIKLKIHVPDMDRGAVCTLYSVGRTNTFVSKDSGFEDLELFENIMIDFLRSRGVPIDSHAASRKVSNLCARFRVSPQVDTVLCGISSVSH
jgi:hypothetical protein